MPKTPACCARRQQVRPPDDGLVGSANWECKRPLCAGRIRPGAALGRGRGRQTCVAAVQAWAHRTQRRPAAWQGRRPNCRAARRPGPRHPTNGNQCHRLGGLEWTRRPPAPSPARGQCGGPAPSTAVPLARRPITAATAGYGRGLWGVDAVGPVDSLHKPSRLVKRNTGIPFLTGPVWPFMKC